jgi:hypothetical protein
VINIVGSVEWGIDGSCRGDCRRDNEVVGHGGYEEEMLGRQVSSTSSETLHSANITDSGIA